MIELLAFISGAVLMALEILGSRVLAPQYGSSVVVWGSLIGVFMGALATGYWLGGMLADRWPRKFFLAVILAGAGALVAAIPFLAPHVFAVAGSALRTGSLVAATALFFLPTALMGTVSPYAIRLKEFMAGHLGRTAGGLYAVSTAGSIAGTIATAFWLIPLAGVSSLIAILGVVLLLLASVAFLWRSSAIERVLGATTIVAAAIILFAAGGALAAPFTTRRTTAMGEKVLLERDSLYHHILVSDDHGLRMLRFDRRQQSAMRLSDPLAGVFAYTDALHLPMALRPGSREVLLIGVGGGTLPKQYLAWYPDVQMDAVDIDADVVAAARVWFGMPESPRLRVHVADGRQFLMLTPKKFDVIIIDAFHVESMPFHLFTREFFRLCRAHLRDGGFVAINLIGTMDGPGSAVVSSVYETIGSALPERYMFDIGWRGRNDPEALRNIVLLAGSGRQMPAAALRAAVSASGFPAAITGHVDDYANRLPDRRFAEVLSDDFAPTDGLLMLADVDHFQIDSSRGARK